jgi:hypothetical protein
MCNCVVFDVLHLLARALAMANVSQLAQLNSILVLETLIHSRRALSLPFLAQ